MTRAIIGMTTSAGGRRALTGVLMGTLLAAGVVQASPADAHTTHDQQVAALRANVMSALSGSTAGGVSVAVDVSGLGPVVRNYAYTSRPAASTEKLFTAFSALRVLGAGHRQSTRLVSSATRAGSHLSGNLYLVAGGDPYFTSAQLDGLAKTIADSGIKVIDGNLVVDDTRYDRVRRGGGWNYAWVPEQSGPLSAMALDRNAWRTDAAYLADPATPVLGKLRSALLLHGVTVGDSFGRGTAPQGAAVLASHVSAPLSEVVRRIDKRSDNFAAELLLKEIGWVSRQSGTTADGAAALRQALTGIGIPVGTVSDGSGLSYDDRQTAYGELTLLRISEGTTDYGALRLSLPVGCVDGTLVYRFCGTPAAGRVAAKTGTTSAARSLTGWTTTADGHRVRFSFLLTSFSSGLSARNAIDRAVVVLASARVE